MEELLQYFQMLLNYAEENASRLNEQSQRALAEFISQIQQLIEELSSPQSQPLNTQRAPTPPPAGMPSSNVAGMQYDNKTGDLRVQFLGKYPNRNGPIYEYGPIPKVMAELLLSGAIPARTKGQNKWGKWFPGKNPSAGASVFTLLKNRNVPFQRLT